MKLTFGVLLTAGTAAFPAAAQEPMLEAKGAFAVEVSAENTGQLRLPIYRNAITSLDVAGGYVIGGTSAVSGLEPYLFAVSLDRRRMVAAVSLEAVVADQQSIRSGFGRGPDGWLYAGTMPGGAKGSGHLIRVRMRGRLEVTDLGVPVPSEGVFAVTAVPGSGIIYGLSHPSGKFFAFHTVDGKAEIYEQTVPDRRALAELSSYVLQPEDYLSRRLVTDSVGRVYGSCPPNRIFRFDPSSKKVAILDAEMPSVVGRRALGRADAWAVAADGALYGSNAADGILFRLEPESGSIVNLGKPVMMPRMKGLAFGPGGTLYGVAGSAPGYTHFFVRDPQRGFEDLGIPEATMTAPNIEQGIRWRGYQIGTVAASEDGRYIVLGEEEALSQLLVLPVQGLRKR